MKEKQYAKCLDQIEKAVFAKVEELRKKDKNAEADRLDQVYEMIMEIFRNEEGIAYYQLRIEQPVGA